MTNENNAKSVHPIKLFGRDRALSTVHAYLISLALTLGVLYIIIRYQLVNTLSLIILFLLFVLPLLACLISLLRIDKEEKRRLEFSIDSEGLFYLNHNNGYGFSLKWYEVETIRPIFFYNHERRLEILSTKGEKRSIDLGEYSFRQINAYSLRRSILHFSGRADIWKGRGPLLLW